MRRITAGTIYGVITTLTISSLIATAVWVEPITSTFTLGGHIAATAGITCACAFFAAVFLFD